MEGSASRACLTPSMTTAQPWSPPMTSTAIRINEKSAGGRRRVLNRSASRGDAEYLAAFIITARRANPVRHVWSGALGASAELRQSQHAVVSAAHTLTAL